MWKGTELNAWLLCQSPFWPSFSLSFLLPFRSPPSPLISSGSFLLIVNVDCCWAGYLNTIRIIQNTIQIQCNETLQEWKCILREMRWLKWVSEMKIDINSKSQFNYTFLCLGSACSVLLRRVKVDGRIGRLPLDPLGNTFPFILSDY